MGKQGIDISYAQTSVDWEKVKAAGVEFAMIRAGYGRELSQKDSMFESHYSGAKEAGIPVGIYWYSYATDADGAKKEAAACLETIKGKQLEFPVAFDIEDATQRDLGADRLTDIAVAFLEEMEQAGYYAVLYSSLDWLRNRFDYERIKRFDLWLAQWREAGPTYENPIGMWQYTSSGSIDGIPGRVDRDMAYKDYEKLIREAGLNGFGTAEESPELVKPARNICQGDSGPDVAWVQQKLCDNGISVGRAGVDGKCGTETVIGIRKYQTLKLLQVDGIAGADTCNHLEKRDVYNPFRRPTENLYQGDHGDGVKWAQWYLIRKDYDVGSTGIDGQYGAQSRAAVEAFQRDHGLTVDGIVGENTRAALEAEEG